MGSFVYDADTDIYSDISIAISNDRGASGTVTEVRSQRIFGAGTIFNGMAASFIGSDPIIPGTPLLSFSTEVGSLLTNSGGVVSLSFLSTGECRAFDVCAESTQNLSRPGPFLTGTPQVAAVPLPASGVLLLGAIGP